jgi:hypothetical protein
MDEKVLADLLNRKIEWMGRLYEHAKDLELYKWVRVSNIAHRCGGPIWVFVETTGIGYVCEKCQEAEVL